MNEDQPSSKKSPRRSASVHRQRVHTSAKVVTALAPKIISATTTRDLLAHVKTLDGGSFTSGYVLLLYLGVRPGEIARIAAAVADKMTSGELVFTEDRLYLGPKFTKAGVARWITLPENVRAFLKVYPPILQIFSTQARALRRQFCISRNGLRNTLCSHLAKKFGLGGAALLAGQSTEIGRKCYLHGGTSSEENELFFSILPTKR